MSTKFFETLDQEIPTTLAEINVLLFRGVMIDIDDTLYSYDAAHESALKFCYKSLDSSIKSKLSVTEFASEYTHARQTITKQLHPQGSCRSRLFAFNLVFEKLECTPSYVIALDFDALYWKEFISNMTLNKEILSFLKRCKKNDLTVCAVSDMQAHIQISKLKKLKLTKYIDHLVTSEEAGAEKPDKRIFRLALQRMKLKKSQVIMIGDSATKDIKGAKDFGLQAFTFQA